MSSFRILFMSQVRVIAMAIVIVSTYFTYSHIYFVIK